MLHADQWVTQIEELRVREVWAMLSLLGTQ